MKKKKKKILIIIFIYPEKKVIIFSSIIFYLLNSDTNFDLTFDQKLWSKINSIDLCFKKKYIKYKLRID